MSIRLVVDEGLNVTDILARTDASPHGVCRGALEFLKDQRIGPSWSKVLREQLAGR